MIAHGNDLPTPRICPLCLTDAHGPRAFSVAVIGDPDAAPGDVQIHVAYPSWASATDEQGYLTLVRSFAGRAHPARRGYVAGQRLAQNDPEPPLYGARHPRA
jgi:hypothetical protein